MRSRKLKALTPLCKCRRHVTTACCWTKMAICGHQAPKWATMNTRNSLFRSTLTPRSRKLSVGFLRAGRRRSSLLSQAAAISKASLGSTVCPMIVNTPSLRNSSFHRLSKEKTFSTSANKLSTFRSEIDTRYSSLTRENCGRADARF